MNLEIERKWILKKLPDEIHPVTKFKESEQIYVSVDPVVRVRRTKLLAGGDNLLGDASKYWLTVKGEGGLSRPEIEIPIDVKQFMEISQAIENPRPINKDNRYYSLLGRCDPEILVDPIEEALRIDVVDHGTADEFIYAEVEFKTEEAALAFEFPFPECEPRDVTGSKYWSMAGYWYRTRLHEGEIFFEDEPIVT